jgi:SAM-dependent methyltransferase
MGIRTTRKKPRQILISIIYRLQKLLPLSNNAKFKLFLNLEWIFDRLSHEISQKFYKPSEWPGRHYSKMFILDNINEEDSILDLGCNTGNISFIVAEKAKEVVGIDYDKKVIDIANQVNKRNNLTFHNREALEFLNENSRHFDILILSHILEHLDNPKEFLLSFKNYFSRIYIEVPDFDRNYLNHYRKDFNMSLIYSDDDHISEFDRDEMRSLLAECGIEISKQEYRYGVQKLWCKVIK